MKPRFKFLTGDVNWREYGGCWVSQKFNNGDFDYWLVIELVNFPDATGELCDGNKYVLTLSSVAPSQVGEAEMKSAMECTGWSDEARKEAGDLGLVEILHTYGCKAELETLYGNNAHQLLRKMKKEAWAKVMMFGFYMDTPKNRIGSTGWDMLKGDVMAGLRRMQAA